MFDSPVKCIHWKELLDEEDDSGNYVDVDKDRKILTCKIQVYRFIG